MCETAKLLHLKGQYQPLTPLFMSVHLGTPLTKLLEISTEKHIITKRNS